jgi:hypothetical protein
MPVEVVRDCLSDDVRSVADIEVAAAVVGDLWAELGAADRRLVSSLINHLRHANNPERYRRPMWF